MPAPTRTTPELVSAPGLRIVAIAAGGALGTLARYGVSRAVVESVNGFPWATFAVNVAGSFLLGVVLTMIVERWSPTRYLRPFAVIGFCGGFTTFSTFTVEAVRRVQLGHPAVGIVYVFASLAAGLAAVGLGVLVARGGRVEPDHLLSADPDADPGSGG
ncbi:MAG TPA: CrcB family protein [Acidimicrobiales bacterium]|nr:CrcB family protein [Acidimicrobiales bacterium]